MRFATPYTYHGAAAAARRYSFVIAQPTGRSTAESNYRPGVASLADLQAATEFAVFVDGSEAPDMVRSRSPGLQTAGISAIPDPFRVTSIAWNELQGGAWDDAPPVTDDPVAVGPIKGVLDFAAEFPRFDGLQPIDTFAFDSFRRWTPANGVFLNVVSGLSVVYADVIDRQTSFSYALRVALPGALQDPVRFWANRLDGIDTGVLAPVTGDREPDGFRRLKIEQTLRTRWNPAFATGGSVVDAAGDVWTVTATAQQGRRRLLDMTLVRDDRVLARN